MKSPEQRTYARGETIHATVFIRWREQFDTILMEFHKLHSPFGGKFGNRIELQSRSTKQYNEEPSPYTKVDFEAGFPDWSNPARTCVGKCAVLFPEVAGKYCSKTSTKSYYGLEI
jgi:hypothetical protein